MYDPKFHANLCFVLLSYLKRRKFWSKIRYGNEASLLKFLFEKNVWWAAIGNFLLERVCIVWSCHVPIIALISMFTNWATTPHQTNEILGQAIFGGFACHTRISYSISWPIGIKCCVGSAYWHLKNIHRWDFQNQLPWVSIHFIENLEPTFRVMALQASERSSELLILFL